MACGGAVVTSTTVGYGDLYPVTTEGRVIAGALMIVGVDDRGAQLRSPEPGGTLPGRPFRPDGRVVQGLPLSDHGLVLG